MTFDRAADGISPRRRFRRLLVALTRRYAAQSCPRITLTAMTMRSVRVVRLHAHSAPCTRFIPRDELARRIVRPAVNPRRDAVGKPDKDI